MQLDGALATFEEAWAPRIVARYNGNEVMVAKARGRFLWHAHPETDDLFLVLGGRLRIELRESGAERSVTLGPGDLYVVPAGVEHCPVAEPEADLLLIEPAGTPNTGDPATAVTKPDIEVPR